MDESSTQMRRSFSMPVKPLHLEPKTLKRSEEKETVYATDDSEGDDDDDANYLRQRSSPAIVANNSRSDIAEPPTLLHGLPKHLRSIRDFIASSMFFIFSIFRKSNVNENEAGGLQANVATTCISTKKDINGQMNTKERDASLESRNEAAGGKQEHATEVEQSNDHDHERERERVVFSL